MGMNLTTDIKKKENAIVLINVTIPKEEVAKQYDNALNKISNKAEIPGFRKGKAPKNIIINKFGKDIEYEALENMLNDAVKDVLDSNGIRNLLKSKSNRYA
jgi:trigger factor